MEVISKKIITPEKVITPEQLDLFIKKATAKLGEKIKELEKSKTELEEKIKERMAEIERRAEELEKSRIALMNILEDVEETRRRAEEERDKTLTIIRTFADGLLVFDKKNNLLLINPQAEDFLKIKAEEVVGKSISELAKISIFTSLSNFLGKKIKKIFREELRLKKNLVVEVTTTPFLRGKEKLGVLVILHDVTREKVIERLKTEFVSLSAHQLRTPLSAIKWTLRMLLDGDLGKITKEQRNFLEKTYRSNERMISLINDLLNVARIEEGRYIFHPTFIHLEKVVQSVTNSFKEEAKRKNIRFQFKKTEKKLPKVLIDEEKIRLVIENLLDNAIRYTFPGGQVTISITLGKKEIELKIQDTGVGIPKDQQGRVFTKFFRAANVMRMETEGTGLGLFTAKNIIEAHGGKIWFGSKEGKGSTFHFTLPFKSSKIK